LLRVSVVRAGTTPGAVHDAEALAGAVASSRIATCGMKLSHVTVRKIIATSGRAAG